MAFRHGIPYPRAPLTWPSHPREPRHFVYETLIALAKKKTHWLANEGYCRILQILRMVIFVPLAGFGIVCLGAAIVQIVGSNHYKDFLAMGLLCLAGSVAAFVAIHGIAWMIVWVIAGFSETKKS